MPSAPERAITPSGMPTAGSTEKEAEEVMTRRSTAVSIPMALPARQARTAKTTHTTATKATMLPQMAYITGEESFSITDIFPCLPSFLPLPAVSQGFEQYTIVSAFLHPKKANLRAFADRDSAGAGQEGQEHLLFWA